MNDLIILTLPCGRHAIIDAADAPLAALYRWRAVGPAKGSYARYVSGFRIGDPHKGRKFVYLHRVLMDTPRHLQVDHINRDGLDCRRSNMRNVTASENCLNRRQAMQKTTPIGDSGFRGVYKRHDSSKWSSSCKVKGRVFYGTYDTPEEAARAYDKIAREHFGAGAILNFPNDRHVE